MLFVLLATYAGVWGCAYFAARRRPGRLGFWLFFAVAAGGVPLISTFVLGAVLRAANPEYGVMIGPLAVQAGIVLAVVVYPIKYLRAKI